METDYRTPAYTYHVMMRYMQSINEANAIFFLFLLNAINKFDKIWRIFKQDYRSDD